MSGPNVYFTLPSFSLLPDPLPQTLPAPPNEHSIRAPFAIQPWLYNLVLRPEIPLTFASLYVITVHYLNAYNKERNNKPWWIARQGFFKHFVVAHNALLTIYSLATFLAMSRAIAVTFPSWHELRSGTGLAGAADALCKLHGPRGLGDATAFNSTINIWEVKNTLIHLGSNGIPDPTDVGRLWNEGLAFWGWWFYVSKFYEVLDTAIILAKGRRSPTLQTFHHSGAMLCMWAGIRYMSPPIWMFVLVNSFIHSLMYTYFTLAALGIKVPRSLKRVLTGMQITQIVWGSSYAAAHLFVQYDIPVSTPYRIAAAVQSAVSSASSGMSSVVSAVSSTVSEVVESPAAAGTLVALAKKLVLRAIGEEGIAERVTNNQGQAIAPRIAERIEQFNERTQPAWETKWRTEMTKVNCIDTSGEAFAIIINLLYLAPLLALFARYFYKEYMSKGKARAASDTTRQLTDSGRVAGERVEDAFDSAGRKAEDKIIAEQAKLQKVDVKDVREQMRRDLQAFKDGTFIGERRVSDHIQTFERQVKTAAQKARQEAQNVYSRSSLSRSSSRRDLKDESALEADSSFAQEALAHPQKSSESESRQESVLEVTAPTRPGAEIQTAGLSSTAHTSREETVSYSEVVKEGSEAFDGHESQYTEEDTDAMGKSGAFVDFAREKFEDVKSSGKDFVESTKDFVDDKTES